MTISTDERARLSAEAMWADDAASKWFGMELLEVSAGQSRMSLTVEAHHANGHGICHGGVIFALADSAFAFACNSHNAVAVAQFNSIAYVVPGRVGDVLTATAREVGLEGRNGIYDVRVINQNGVTIAEFRGCSRVIAGRHFEE